MSVNMKQKIKQHKVRFILIICFSILIITIMWTRIILAKKTYKIIEHQKQIEVIRLDREDLNEKISKLSSISLIRKRAMDELGMIPVEGVEDLIDTVSP